MRTLLIGLLFVTVNAYSQRDTNKKRDTIIAPIQLKEVVLSTQIDAKIQNQLKKSSTIDELLSTSESISFIKRGAYAWEPLLNNMSSERSSITIDGMHIFGACTDKMDPITSYMESNSIDDIEIQSGQEGNMQGATIAGSIDLKRKKTAFSEYRLWELMYETGYESNNNQLFKLAKLSFSTNKWATDATFSYRNADNYYDGKGNEVKNSQFNKINSSLGVAYKSSAFSSLRFDAILDVAKDVGFPALPMDLWLSRALITSLSYTQLLFGKENYIWNTKAYFNTIEHYMDDTTRPENLVHMDMPGWSTTYGVLSNLIIDKEISTTEIQFNAYNNQSIAEMHMYPQDRSKQTMFAYSWPWISTFYSGIAIHHLLKISEKNKLSAGMNLGAHYNHSKYPEFNWIFYPDAPKEKTRFLPSFTINYTHYSTHNLSFSLGSGYGHRAPSVSEGYGYYIYNSFDRYDYIGNPNLKNEISYEINASANYNKKKIKVSAKANYFYIENYIIGKILSLGSPMNYQSVGVKGYTSIAHARLFNFSLQVQYDVLNNLIWTSNLGYSRAKDDRGKNLPFIRPLNYSSLLRFNQGKLGIQTSLNGDAKHIDFSPEYGESPSSAFMIWNLSADYTFFIHTIKNTVQIGIENILSENYTTYADWGNIPRMGRNLYTSIKITF